MTLPVPAAETLTVEFKSDRKHLDLNALAEAVICLANAEGEPICKGVGDSV